jgi:3(or 17)beta-hydroxysteroid dehydrogenase
MYADADLVAYDSSKGAVCSLTKEVAVYCAKKGYRIRCNSIHPGTIKTPMLDRFFAENDIPDELHDSWMHDIPLGRSGTPDEVGHLVAFLASDRSSFMTGSECVIDGGVTA